MLRYNIKQSGIGSVLVRVEEALDTTFKHGSLEVFIDPLFNPTHHARIYGIVEAIPSGKCFNEDGLEIEQEVRVGDKIYFHYLITSDEINCVYSNTYKVPYHWIFCIVRNGNILPVSGWTLCSQIDEDKENFELVEVGGRMMNLSLSGSGLITSIQKKKSIKFAELSYIGLPLKGEKKLDIEKGCKIVLNKNSNFINKIEGVDFFTVRQSDILGEKLD